MMSLVLLSGCGGNFKPNEETPQSAKDRFTRDLEEFGKLGGGDGLLNELIRGREGAGVGTGIGVNAYLWQASLDTLSFMPLSSADSYGGVIVTDWYTPNADAASRYKVNVYIVGRELRATALRVASFKQKSVAGQWVDIEDNALINEQLEDAILTKARQLRIDSGNIAE